MIRISVFRQAESQHHLIIKEIIPHFSLTVYCFCAEIAAFYPVFQDF